jgi:universal stress protein A
MVISQRLEVTIMPDGFPSPTLGPSKLSHESIPSTDADDQLTYARILVPTDFSECSKKSTSYAGRFALRNNAALFLLHVFEPSHYPITGDEYAKPSSELLKCQADIAEGSTAASLAKIESELRNRGVEAEAYQRVGCPFDEIVKMAKYLKVDLIIIGSHGRTGLAHLLIGSVAERVVEHAQCPVLVVK